MSSIGFIIVCTKDEDLVWSNSFGWIDSDGDFDTLTEEEHATLNLPIEGEWRQVQWKVN